MMHNYYYLYYNKYYHYIIIIIIYHASTMIADKMFRHSTSNIAVEVNTDVDVPNIENVELVLGFCDRAS